MRPHTILVALSLIGMTPSAFSARLSQRRASGCRRKEEDFAIARAFAWDHFVAIPRQDFCHRYLRRALQELRSARRSALPSICRAHSMTVERCWKDRDSAGSPFRRT